MSAARRLIGIYSGLAQRGEHLFGRLLAGQAPRQWRHYPEDDAIDHGSGFQWFYHSHSPEDRPGAKEHGHIHLFARRKLWSRRLASAREREFASLADGPQARIDTRHLLALGFDAKGLPISVFTVNSWVTGDLMLSGATTAALLEKLSLGTGHGEVDAVIECVVALCRNDIRRMLDARDSRLFSRRAHGMLHDEKLELLSELPIDIDGQLASWRSRGSTWQTAPAAPPRARARAP